MARVPSRTARDYDLGIIVNPEVGDEHARTIVERVTQSIASNGGEVMRVNAVGRRRLAYPIEHHRDGLYFFFDMTMPPTAVAEVERSLRVNEDIMRHLMLIRDPRAVAQQRQREAEVEAEAQARAAEQAALAEQAAAEAEARGAENVAESAAEAQGAESDGEAAGEAAPAAEANA